MPLMPVPGVPAENPPQPTRTTSGLALLTEIESFMHRAIVSPEFISKFLV